MRRYIATLFITFVMGNYAIAQTNSPNNTTPKGLDTLNTQALDEVLITATRTQRTIAQLPLPVQVISKTYIRNTGLSRLVDVLREQTGIVTVPTYGGMEGIQMQGLDAAYVMVLVDGQPLIGRSSGTLDLSRITVNNIERIEIVKGASSSLYGSEALAGVINIITSMPKLDGKVHADVNYRIASLNTHDAAMGLSYGKSKVAAEVFVNRYSSSGYNFSKDAFIPTVQPFVNYTVQPKLKYFINDKVSLLYNSRMYHQTQKLTSIISDNKYTGESYVNEWNQFLTVKQEVQPKLNIDYDLYASMYRSRQYQKDVITGEPFAIDYYDDYYKQLFLRPEARAYYQQGKRNRVTMGLGGNYERLDRSSFSQVAQLYSEYVFGQYEWFPLKKVNILAGFRYDHHHQYASQLSPKLAMNYELTKEISLKSSIGYGYKAPDLRQLYFDFSNSAVGYNVFGYNVAQELLAKLEATGQVTSKENLDFSIPLKPESSLNFNFGVAYRKAQWIVEANIFNNYISHLIDTRAIASKTNGQRVFSYFGLNKIYTRGLELNTSYKPIPNWFFSIGYQYLIAKDEAVKEDLRNGKVFARDAATLSTFKLESADYFGLMNRSKHTANIKIAYTHPAWRSGMDVRAYYRSKYGLGDSNGNGILDNYDRFAKGYLLTNISLHKDFYKTLSIHLGVQNLFNYTDPVNIPNIPGRQWFSRVAYTF